MKYKFKTKPPVQIGSTRVIRKFLFLPKYIDGEIRWFEYAEIKQRYMKLTRLIPGMKTKNTVVTWADIEWADGDLEKPA